MPPLSTHMHFGKIFIENSDEEIDIKSFLMGIVSPDTFNDETFEDFHCLDEDGNIDVREFYEQFDLKKLNKEQRSFVLGYYCHLWLDEYYKFNASKLIIHNSFDFVNEELSIAVKNILRYYDSKAIGNYFEKMKSEINKFNINLNLKEFEGISLSAVKQKLIEFFKEPVPEKFYKQLIDEDEYMSFIKKSCSKIYKSL